MKLNCLHSSTCLVDHWNGHKLPWVCIYVTGRKMSLREIREAIKNELRNGFVYGSSRDARLLSADCVHEDDVKRAGSLTRAAYAAVNRDIRGSKKGQRFIDTGCDVRKDDTGDSVYMYFVFQED